MSTSTRNAQRGQAMAEFVVGMLLFLPIILGVIYLGKFEDVKYTSVQASRYAALERVFDPSGTHKSANVIGDETRERFFRDPMQQNQGAVGFQDSTAGLQTTTSLAKNWFGAGSEPLIKNYDGIQVNLSSAATSGLATSINSLVVDLNYKGAITDPGIQQAQVQTSLVVPAFLSKLTGTSLTLSTTTAVLADGYNSAGDGSAANPAANTTRGRVDKNWGGVLGASQGLTNALEAITTNRVVETGWEALSDTPGPQLFCRSPDVVPADATSPGANYAANSNGPACPNPQ